MSLVIHVSSCKEISRWAACPPSSLWSSILFRSYWLGQLWPPPHTAVAVVTQLTHWECSPGLQPQVLILGLPLPHPLKLRIVRRRPFPFLLRWCLKVSSVFKLKGTFFYLFTENYQIKKIFKNTKTDDESDLDATVSCPALLPCSGEVILEALRSVSYSCRWLAEGLENWLTLVWLLSCDMPFSL